MWKFLIDVGQNVEMSCYSDIPVLMGQFRVEAENAKIASLKALDWAKNFEIEDAVVLGISCEEIAYVL